MSISSANSTLVIGITSLFPVPQQIQGFSADDIYSVDTLEVVETMMGVDGFLSGGFVNVPVNWTISLQADSPSNAFFEQWFIAQKKAQDIYTANGSITLPSRGYKWTLTNGMLVSFPPIPSAGRTLRPRQYATRWQSIAPSPI